MTLRIATGNWRGRRIDSAYSAKLRPTSSKLREAIFAMAARAMGGNIIGARALDVFAGAGTLGIEALSCGASHVTFIDSHAPACRTIRENLRSIGAEHLATVMRIDVTRLRPRSASAAPANLVFLDPPYGSGLAVQAIVRLGSGGWLAAGALAMIETAQRDGPLTPPPGFESIISRSYGDTLLTGLQFANNGETHNSQARAEAPSDSDSDSDR